MLFSVRVLQKLLTVVGHLGSWEVTKGRGGGRRGPALVVFIETHLLLSLFNTFFS